MNAIGELNFYVETNACCLHLCVSVEMKLFLWQMPIVAIKYPALKTWTEMFNANMVESKTGGYHVTDPASKLHYLGTKQYSVQISCNVLEKLLCVEGFHFAMSKFKVFRSSTLHSF